jgi:hypothetical protein
VGVQPRYLEWFDGDARASRGQFVRGGGVSKGRHVGQVRLWDSLLP